MNSKSWRAQYPTFITDEVTGLKINKKTDDMNNTINQPHLTDIHRSHNPKAAGHTFFSGAHGTFSSILQTYDVRSLKNLNRLKRGKIIQCIFFHHSGIKLEINGRRKSEKFTTMWKLSIITNTEITMWKLLMISNTEITNDWTKKTQIKLENTLR